MDFLVKEEILKFKNKYNELEIEVGDKLYYDESNNIHVLKAGYFQSISRMIYSQDRHSFYEKFKKEIKRLNKILSSLLLNNNIFIINFNQNNLVYIQDIKNLHKKLLDIIKILKKTYENDKEFILKLTNLEDKIHFYYKN